MSSATVLDSILEGVRADVAAREVVIPLADVKAAGEHAEKAADASKDASKAAAKATKDAQ